MFSQFSRKNVFEYNYFAKLRFAIISLTLIGLIILLFLSYLLFLQDQNIAFFELTKQLIQHIQNEIGIASIKGVLYTSTIGGLFFVTIPLEVVFVNFLRTGINPFLLVFLYVGGFFISFTINYYVGLKLDTFSKKIITPKKFYKFKGILNKHGALAVFLFNLIPFFPAQPLSTILGVFRYNKTKFYVYFAAGQLVKFTVITIGYLYIFGT